jgi:alpha-galactosidase
MKTVLNYLTTCLLIFLLTSCTGPKKTIFLDEFDLSGMKTGWGAPQINKSFRGTPLSVGNKEYIRGVGTVATSSFLISVNGKGKSFYSKVGVDNSSNESGSVIFYVLGDKKILWESGLMRKGDSIKVIDLNIKDISKIGLLVSDANDGNSRDYANWIETRIEYSGIVPTAVPANLITEGEILTPEAPAEPRINGPKIYGMRPGSPFLYRVPATGERPMSFEIKGLPSSLKLNNETGIISGTVSKPGRYNLGLVARNSKGESSRPFTIVVGNTLALTPPMGWNSWYIHYNRISDSLMRLSADVMISSGMADYGYQYVNIDDCWMRKENSDDPVLGGPSRDKNGIILTNKRFPDMKGLTSYIHEKGLKAGIYISPGPTTCAGFAGSLGYEKKDAETFASWGYDFLKYDWCSYGSVVKGRTVEDFKAPYKLMWSELQKLDRDIVLNLCQYGMGESWKWAGEVGNSWRTTGDLGLESSSTMPGFFNIGISNAQHSEYARQGAWNDPDYILIGWVGSANSMGEGKKTTLTPDEQYTYMSMWSLMASPLIFSGDMAKLDKFTLNVLCNNEVIDVNQDQLGRQAKILKYADNELIMVKDLEDGSKAAGLFYVSGNPPVPSDYFEWDPQRYPKKIKVNLKEIGIDGKANVRDVWRQKSLGSFENSFEIDVPWHGVAFLKITKE